MQKFTDIAYYNYPFQQYGDDSITCLEEFDKEYEWIKQEYKITTDYLDADYDKLSYGPIFRDLYVKFCTHIRDKWWIDNSSPIALKSNSRVASSIRAISKKSKIVVNLIYGDIQRWFVADHDMDTKLILSRIMTINDEMVNAGLLPMYNSAEITSINICEFNGNITADNRYRLFVEDNKITTVFKKPHVIDKKNHDKLIKKCATLIKDIDCRNYIIDVYKTKVNDKTKYHIYNMRPLEQWTKTM
jgi:hypothetical protein